MSNGYYIREPSSVKARSIDIELPSRRGYLTMADLVGVHFYTRPMTLIEDRQQEVTVSKRPAISYVIEGLGVAGALGALILGWLGTIPEEPHFEVGREVFGNIPDAIQLVFYVTVAVFIWVSLHLFARRATEWERGRPESRVGMWGRRLKDLDAALRMKTLMRDPRMGVMHSLIYYGFIVLFLGTVTLEIDHLLPSNLKFLRGPVYQGYSAILDLASLAYLGGLALAVVNRYLLPPDRIRTKTKPEDALILGLLFVLGLSGLLTEAARISLAGRPDFEIWSFVGHPLSSLIPENAAADLHQVFWIGHVLGFVAFLVILPVTKLRHMLTSPANMFLSAHPRPKGAMRAMPNLLEVDDIETIGASLATDLTWKQIFDTDACTVCGRCTSVCPANITGKPLDPREIVLKTGEVAAAAAGLSPPLSSVIMLEGEHSLFDRVRPDEVFACTTCRACDEICPVDIEILDKILDMRRYLTLMESEFPSELKGLRRHGEPVQPMGHEPTESSLLDRGAGL